MTENKQDYWVSYSSYREYEEIPDYLKDDDWYRGNCTVITEFNKIYATRPTNCYYRLDVVQGPKNLKTQGHLVVATYTDGDTFGSTSGQTELLEIFASHEEAEHFITTVDRKRWQGWFSGLQNISTITLSIEE